jgi:hypothetical protein
MDAGYDSVMCINLRRDDKTFLRGFRYVGDGRVVASLMEFKFWAE